jgi:hypothetical protein
MNETILDQGWGEFRRQLEYKQAWRGGEVLAIDPLDDGLALKTKFYFIFNFLAYGVPKVAANAQSKLKHVETALPLPPRKIQLSARACFLYTPTLRRPVENTCFPLGRVLSCLVNSST